MTSRKQTRARPTPRREMQRAYTELFGGLLSRRALLTGSASLALAAGAGRLLPAPAIAAEAASSLTFAELTRVKDDRDHWPEGYDRQILIRWGDPLVGSASVDFDPAHLTGEEQAKRFGYNNDFMAYIPLGEGEAASAHGLLVVNHEYAAPYLMWPGLTDEDYREKLSDEQIRAVKAAVGIAVLEVRKAGNAWELVPGKYNRRITLDTPIALSGPCAGHDRMKTKADPDGRTVLGTMPNCNGGLTPWSTVLSGEEGAMDFFSGDYSVLPDQELVERQGWDEDENDEYALGRIESRFRFAEEPNEWNRFDWVVELDPLEPESKPVKRTALGRFTHEGAQVVLNHDGRVVVFMGDDDDFEYLYRFVTTGTYDPADRATNKDLLDAGVLSAARFSENGGLTWLPLVFGQGPLTAANGFTDQAEVLFRTRQAADLLGATPMDGPEGFIPNLATGRIYVAMTENEDRLPAGEGDEGEQVNVANPRGPNPDGHLLELIPPRDRRPDRLGFRELRLGRLRALRRSGRRLTEDADEPGNERERLVHRSRQSERRSAGPAVGVHRRSAAERLRRCSLRDGHARTGQGAVETVLHSAGRLGMLLAGLHARWADRVHLCAASGRAAPRRRGRREPRRHEHGLAGFSARHAGATVRGRAEPS